MMILVDSSALNTAPEIIALRSVSMELSMYELSVFSLTFLLQNR